MRIQHIYSLMAICAALVIALSVSTQAFAGEIHYSSIAEIKNDVILAVSKSPAGDQWFLCKDDGSCTGTTTSVIFPAIAGSRDYVKNTQGTLAVKEIPLGTASYYVLYDLRQSTPTTLGMLPFITPGMSIRFSPSGNQIILIKGGVVSTYDVITKKSNTVQITQTELPFLSISYNGSYLAAYNYIGAASRVWHLTDGTVSEIPTTTPGYVEFSHDEQYAAYINTIQGFKTLYTLDLRTFSTVAPRQITKPNTITEDYLFVGTTLFYLANPDNPLNWNLYAYDPAKNTSSLVDTDVSYGDYLKRVLGKLAYIKVNGKNAEVHLYDPTSKRSVTLATATASPAPTTVTHTPGYLAERYTVLIAPKQDSSHTSARNLFVWLHGGPARQIAVGYHSYLSYAVYDELLDRIASAGNYVLKVDYTGSTGYGSEFEKALHGNIGIKDVNDVEKVVAAFKRDHKVGNVYLIGNSYGGYLALRTLVSQPGTFKGAISINGVTNWYTLIQQIPSSPFAALFDGVPDTTNLDKYFKASVFIDIPKLTDDHKVLIAYGEDDDEVPTWQSTQYMEYAQSKNLAAAVISFPGEQHVLRKRSTLDSLCSKIVDHFSLKGVSCSL